MSRVGRRTITLGDGVTVNVNKNIVTVKGPKGELTKEFSPLITVSVDDKGIKTSRANENKQTKMLHGTTNSLIQGMVTGVTKGFEKELEIIGVGYNVKAQGNGLQFSLGLSHKVDLEIPEHLKVEIISPTALKVTGIDKQQVGEFAAKIKAFRKPEPYGGKGIRYKGEFIIRKSGKASK
ncbi:MAG: 50S ribosomal protein L6 [Candidatus Tyloplasma litorale]|nr:MAG: 50S ribosomal protein L6 [Mycoplasmatales bacterium]